MQSNLKNIGVVGSGAMGRGIAQLAAQGGCHVWLYDSHPEASAGARQAIESVWGSLVAKGRLQEGDAQLAGARLNVASSLQQLAQCQLVIEAITEDLGAKQALMSQLEPLIAQDAVLATNTSSLSVTAIGAALQRPERMAGLHFFNPVPLMKVVEVVPGARTDAAVCQTLAAWVKALGHTPVRAQDTPGFIVNHAGRGYGTEALRVLSENVSDVPTIDRILKDQLGFKLGPFELLDLTGLDVSHPVMASIYHQYFEEPRYRPSAIAAQRLAGGLLGRKTGQGFYAYGPQGAVVAPEPPVPASAAPRPVWVSPKAARRPEIYQYLKDAGASIENGTAPSSQALILVAPLGLDVTTLAAVERLDPSRTVGIDMMLPDAAVKRRVLATNPATRADMRDAAHALFAQDGKAVSVIRDSGGFVSQRVAATIVNIAADMCQQGICTPADLDTAVTLGLGYPQGPLALGDSIGPTNVLEILFNLQTVYGDPRYRPSPWLRRRGALGLSLKHEET